MKNLRVIAALLLAFGHLFLAFPAQAAQTGAVQVTCAKNGVQSTYQVGWDNSNQFFMGKGNIAALYCTGGFSPLGQDATYVSDTLTNNALRYYNGVAPEPSPAPEPTSTVSPEPPSQSEQLPGTSSPDLSSTSSETVSPEVDPSESAPVEPTPTPSESSPIESQSPQVEPTPTASPEPEQPTESPTLSPQPESSSPQPTPIMWDYVVDEGGVLEAQAPTGMVFSRVVARYVAHDSDCGIDVSEIVSAALVGSSSGTINADNNVFGDPCPGWYKKLVVSVEYTSAVVVPPVISPEPSQPPVLPPQPTPQPEPSPEPQPEPSPEPSPVEPTPTPTPEPQPEITPSPEPTPEPPQPEEPTEPVPTSEPTPVPEPEEPAPTVDPEPEPSPEPEPEPSEEPEPAPTTPEDVTFDTPIEDVVAVLEDVVPTSLTEEQAAVLVSIALETFETAEQGSPEYEAALDLLLVAAQQDDVVLDEALAAIPLLGNVAGAAVEVFNALGNAGADMSPQVREQSEKVVIAAVIVGQIALTATSAATSAAAAAARRP